MRWDEIEAEKQESSLQDLFPAAAGPLGMSEIYKQLKVAYPELFEKAEERKIIAKGIARSNPLGREVWGGMGFKPGAFNLDALGVSVSPIQSNYKHALDMLDVVKQGRIPPEWEDYAKYFDTLKRGEGYVNFDVPAHFRTSPLTVPEELADTIVHESLHPTMDVLRRFIGLRPVEEEEFIQRIAGPVSRGKNVGGTDQRLLDTIDALTKQEFVVPSDPRTRIPSTKEWYSPPGRSLKTMQQMQKGRVAARVPVVKKLAAALKILAPIVTKGKVKIK